MKQGPKKLTNSQKNELYEKLTKSIQNLTYLLEKVDSDDRYISDINDPDKPSFMAEREVLTRVKEGKAVKYKRDEERSWVKSA